MAIEMTQEQQQFQRKVESLLEDAPSDSTSESYLNSVKLGYEGVLQIVSSQGRFVAKAVSTNLNEVLVSVAKQINEQLREWRGYRVLTD